MDAVAVPIRLVKDGKRWCACVSARTIGLGPDTVTFSADTSSAAIRGLRSQLETVLGVPVLPLLESA
jgi:hypothetical protein